MTAAIQFDQLRLPPECEKLREEVRAFIAEETEAGTIRPSGATGGDSFSREFSRKATTRATVSLRIPALLGFLKDVDEMKDDYDKRRAAPAQAAALDGDGVADDIVDIRIDTGPAADEVEPSPDESGALNGKVAIWRNRAPAEHQSTTLGDQLRTFSIDSLLEEYATRRLDQLDDGGTLSIGLEDIKKLLVTPGWDLHQARKGTPPDREYPLAFPPKGTRLRVEDLDGDGVTDVIAIGRDPELRQVVQFLVMR